MTLRISSYRVPDPKFARELLRRLPAGYRIGFGELDGRKVGDHPYLFDPSGDVVRGSDGKPVVVSGTPSRSRRVLHSTLAKIRRAGIEVTR